VRFKSAICVVVSPASCVAESQPISFALRP
jgi:hypothetical protein